MLLPFFEKPGWCIKSADLDADTTAGYWYCQNEQGTIANSHIPKLPAIATNLIYIVCLIVLWTFTKMRDVYRKRDSHDRVNLQLGLMAAAMVNLVITIAVICIPFTQTTRDDSFFVKFFIYPYINAFIRPALFSLSVRSVKSFWRRYITVIIGSLPMGIFIFLYVFYFAWMGNRLFAGTIEGVENFADLNDSFFFMFVLLTTSNYPDVMLPSYAQQRRYAIFYIVYLVVGLFMLMNLLLAIFYAKYQERVDAAIDKFMVMRNSYLVQMFRQYEEHENP